ncbi:hypothetical protein SISSUDRAFT_1046114 [Sistotremastrum suecicum HHB10207 ss-3]|uniref:Uncharacterized protein n=1 Tax=Sistotremastrum suecicum HHB10207 ss-3 TaxID=1314776 RepID=A0A166DZR1_9AGAM|nr:hypothetical protein SISSUDRAFT_1046114 [Sistotremastrum suecicum HHB10207 ss-3]
MDSSERGLKIRGEKRGIEVSKSETDFVLQNWTKSNWATFVSAAPLAIESLGGLLLTSSGLIDFNIVSNLTPEQAKSFFPLTKAPSTFKAALLDVSVAAKDAFFNAQSNMDTIGLTTRSLRDDVFQNVINILRRPDPERIRKLLPKRIALMLELTAKCEKAAKNSEENFEALAVLTRELRLATLQKGVTNRAELDQINRSLAYTGEILTGERLQLESLEADAKKANERIKTAEKDLTKAFDDFPPHSTLIKYFLLDAGVMFGKFAIGAIFPVVGAGMAFNELKKKLNKKDDDDSDSENDKDDKSTFDTVDPNLVISRKLLIAAKMTGVLLGLEGSTVDWDRIVTDSSAGKGVGYIVQKMVAESLTSLAAETQTDLGQEVKEQGDILSKLVDDVLKLATTTKSASDVAGLRVKNDGVIDSLESLDPATSGITQSSKAQKKSKSGSLYGEQAIDSALVSKL